MFPSLPQCNCLDPKRNPYQLCPIHSRTTLQYYPTVLGNLCLYLPDPAAAPAVAQADQPFVGFRTWSHTCEHRTFRLTPFSPVRYVPDRIMLKSVGAGTGLASPWNDPVATARCRFTDPATHAVPSRECECGLYTWKSPGQVGGFGPRAALWGAVLAWGRVIEHTEGFRSQYARIICLADNGNEITEYAARQRGIPMVPAKRVEVYASEFGKLLPFG